MKTEVTASRTDVVLGDDWVGPGDAVRSEVRATRAKRGFLSISSSPLARKIVLFNLVALVILVVSVLFTNPFRDSLLRQQEQTLRQTAQIVADIVAAAGGSMPRKMSLPAALRWMNALRLSLSRKMEPLPRS